jgi:hypothetical protein
VRMEALSAYEGSRMRTEWPQAYIWPVERRDAQREGARMRGFEGFEGRKVDDRGVGMQVGRVFEEPRQPGS